ncbi:MAG: alcohol dehydrogenase catalytic domain-containing protein [Candidatus Melainabacteria bacterium]|nr:alcohol dehydrogenase catalytic domain-containing protein [Candidatus Melainabacteria bacterium]
MSFVPHPSSNIVSDANQHTGETLTEQSGLPSRMNAARFYEPGVVRYESIPVPALAAGEILVQVEAALTCGTDLKSYRRGHPVLFKSLPALFGHEFSGKVAALGPQVSQFSVGDRVAVANSAPCYQCFYCHQGQYNLCEHLEFLNGAYAEYVVVPASIVARNTYRIPDYLPAEVAAFTEPLAVCLRGVELSGISPDDRVAIIGLGPIGQLLVKLAKWKGAHVTAMARSPYKREVAQRFGGADAVADLSTDTDASSLKTTLTPNGRGFDVVIEAVGMPETWRLALALVRPGGRVNWFGGCESGTTVPVDTRQLHYQEITLLSLFHHTPPYVKKALDLLVQQTIDPSPLITQRMPMSEITAALEQVAAGRAMKIQLSPFSS